MLKNIIWYIKIVSQLGTCVWTYNNGNPHNTKVCCSNLELQTCPSGHSCQWSRLCFGPWWWKPAEVTGCYMLFLQFTHHTVKRSNSMKGNIWRGHWLLWTPGSGPVQTWRRRWSCPPPLSSLLSWVPAGFHSDALITSNTDGTIITWLRLQSLSDFTVTHALMITSQWSANLPQGWGALIARQARFIQARISLGGGLQTLSVCYGNIYSSLQYFVRMQTKPGEGVVRCSALLLSQDHMRDYSVGPGWWQDGTLWLVWSEIPQRRGLCWSIYMTAKEVWKTVWGDAEQWHHTAWIRGPLDSCCLTLVVD